jgi:hypothetical protein
MVAAQVQLLAPQLNLLRARRPLCASGGIGNGQVEAVAEAEDVAAFGSPCLRGAKDLAEEFANRRLLGGEAGMLACSPKLACDIGRFLCEDGGGSG